MKVKVLFLSYVFDPRGLLKLGRFSGEYLALSSWCSSLAAKLSVYGRMELVSDMVTDEKRKIRTNNLGMIFPFLSIS